MKKFLSIITTLALLASLTACSGGDDQNSNSTNGGQDSNQSTEQSTDQSTENQSSEPPEQSAAYIRAFIDKFEMDDFPAPDGTVLKKADATLIQEPFAVGYEFSYVRKVQPVFSNTIDEPDMINWDTLEFTPALSEPPEDLGYFKIKAGDVLDNGLTVKSAEIYFGNGIDGQLYYTKAEFDGELTLEGVLYCLPEDGYNTSKGDVFFFPDGIKHPDLITPYTELEFEPARFYDVDINFAVAYSGNIIRLGNESDLPSDISELFRHKSSFKASVTLTDFGYYQTMMGVLSFAEITDAVEL